MYVFAKNMYAICRLHVGFMQAYTSRKYSKYKILSIIYVGMQATIRFLKKLQKREKQKNEIFSREYESSSEKISKFAIEIKYNTR